MESADATFDLPYYPVGKKPVIVQGFHGPYHARVPTPMKLDYAVDLALPISTIVTASRSGIVREFSMTSDRYFRDPDLTPEQIRDATRYLTNWILLEHPEGMLTLYAHLEKGSQRIAKGQQVHAGQMIARTGLSGWVGDIDNLHFQVLRWLRPLQPFGRAGYETVPFRFRGYEGPMEHKQLFARS